MTLEQLLLTYGYPLLFVGTFLEGETIVVIAAYLAHRGYLSLPLVMAAAFLGSFGGDQLYFHLGRTKGQALLKKHRAWEVGTARARRLLDRYGVLFVLGFRFLYGLRTISPFAIGLCKYPVRRFILLNGLGGIVWAVVVAGGGYLFGNVVEIVLKDARKYEIEVVVLLILVGTGLWAFRRLRQRRAARRSESGLE